MGFLLICELPAFSPACGYKAAQAARRSGHRRSGRLQSPLPERACQTGAAHSPIRRDGSRGGMPHHESGGRSCHSAPGTSSAPRDGRCARRAAADNGRRHGTRRPDGARGRQPRASLRRHAACTSAWSQAATRRLVSSALNASRSVRQPRHLRGRSFCRLSVRFSTASRMSSNVHPIGYTMGMKRFVGMARSRKTEGNAASAPAGASSGASGT